MDDLSEDKVWFVEDPKRPGRIISRMVLPDNAVRLSISAEGATIPGGEDRLYEVWVPIDEDDAESE